MGVDGNFAGGFSQGVQPLLTGIRQDRRDASQRAFKDKLINEDRTAQANIRTENQKIRSDKDFMSNLFRAQQQGTENDRFVLQQGLGRTLQDAQRTRSQSRGAAQQAQNAVAVLEQNKLKLVEQQLGLLVKAAPGGIVDQNTLNAARQRFTLDAENQFGPELRAAKLRANDAFNSDREGGLRLEDLQNQFQSSVSEISNRNSLRNIANSDKGRLLQQSFGKTDDDISKLFGELGEPTQQNGIDLFGTSQPTPANFEVAPATPQSALQAEREFATQEQVTKTIKKADPHNAIKQVSQLQVDENTAPGAKDEINKVFSDINNRLTGIVSKNSKDKLSPSEIDTLTTLFNDANNLSEEQLGSFALRNQEDAPVTSGEGLTSRFALNNVTSPNLSKRVDALKKRISGINPKLVSRTQFNIQGNEFKPAKDDDLATLLRKQQGWEAAGRPTIKKRGQRASLVQDRVAGFFRDAIQSSTEAKQQQNLVDSIEQFRAKLVTNVR